MDAATISKVRRLHKKVEDQLSVDVEDAIRELIGKDAWEAWQELGDIINPTESESPPDEVTHGEFWNRLN